MNLLDELGRVERERYGTNVITDVVHIHLGDDDCVTVLDLATGRVSWQGKIYGLYCDKVALQICRAILHYYRSALPGSLEEYMATA